MENHFATGQSVNRRVSTSNVLTWMVGWLIPSCRIRVCYRNIILRAFRAFADGSYDAHAAFGVGHGLTNQFDYGPGISNGDKDPPFYGKLNVLGATSSTLFFSPRSRFHQITARTARTRCTVHVVHNLLQAPRVITVCAPW